MATHRREPSELGRLIERAAAVQRLESAEPALAERLRELRHWQAARLARTYEDLAHDARQAPAIEFFLTDLYGPQDFGPRDRDLARAGPLLQRALPRGALRVLIDAIELYALSGELDQALARALPPGPIDPANYAHAYRAAGRAADRQHQIELIVRIGERLAQAVRQPLIGLTLRATHLPAHLAGFGALQDFLERGFDAFHRLGDARIFLDAIRARESALSTALLRGDASALGA